MAKKKTDFVFIQVMQNGAPVASTRCPLASRSSLKMTGAKKGPLAIPYYPFPSRSVGLVKVKSGRAILKTNHKMAGFATSKGEAVVIERQDKRRKVTMTRGDYASISYDDLRVLIRIGSARDRKEKIGRQASQYRGPAFHQMFEIKEERMGMLGAVVLATMLFSGFLLGLAHRTFQRPQDLGDLEKEYSLPFIHPDHLEHAPEALQTNLNRKDYVGSVLAYYKSVTAVLIGEGWIDDRFVYQSSRDLYTELHDEVQDRVDEITTRQRKLDELNSSSREKSVVPIPAVVGESFTGKTLRAIDKVGILHDGYRMALQQRQGVHESFKQDELYDFENYQERKRQNNATAEYLKSIRVFKRLTDEEQMYQEARQLGNEAYAARKRVFEGVALESLEPARYSPIALPGGVKFASFVSDIDFRLLDEKIFHLEAVDFGRKKLGASQAKQQGELDPSLIKKHVRGKRYELKLCYENALRRDEGAEGVVQWQWRIDPRGRTTNVALVSTTIQDERMVRCMRSKIRRWKFPRPRRGSVDVSYGFEFNRSRG